MSAVLLTQNNWGLWFKSQICLYWHLDNTTLISNFLMLKKKKSNPCFFNLLGPSHLDSYMSLFHLHHNENRTSDGWGVQLWQKHSSLLIVFTEGGAAGKGGGDTLSFNGVPTSPERQSRVQGVSTSLNIQKCKISMENCFPIGVSCRKIR